MPTSTPPASPFPHPPNVSYDGFDINAELELITCTLISIDPKDLPAVQAPLQPLLLGAEFLDLYSKYSCDVHCMTVSSHCFIGLFHNVLHNQANTWLFIMKEATLILCRDLIINDVTLKSLIPSLRFSKESIFSVINAVIQKHHIIVTLTNGKFYLCSLVMT